MPEKPRVFATLDVDPAPDPEAGLGHSVVPHVQEARVACLRFAPLGSGKLTKAIQEGQLLMTKKHVRVSHLPSGTTLAEGPVSWDILPFEGELLHIAQMSSNTGIQTQLHSRNRFLQMLYVWLDLHFDNGHKVRNRGWLYWLPTPLFPFIWHRVGISQRHPELAVEEIGASLKESDYQ